MILKTKDFEVGDVVIRIDGVLHCGTYIYTHAICVSLEPFILVSDSGDILWCKVPIEECKALCKADKQYAQRDAMKLDRAGNYFAKHMEAMTTERLHSKSDIACELAVRDLAIDKLKVFGGHRNDAECFCEKLKHDDYPCTCGWEELNEH